MSPSFEGNISATLAMLFIREADARGVECSAALRAAGMARDERRRAVPWADCVRLIEALLELAPGDDLGVLAGTRATLADLDLAGLYVRSESSGQRALEFHERYAELFQPSPFVRTQASGDRIVISLPPRALTRAQNALAECALSSAMTLTGPLTGHVEPIGVRLRHERPADDAAHARVFGPSLRFGAAIDAVVYSSDILERALPHRDDAVRAVLRPHLARQLEAVQAERSDPTARALDAIRELLAGGTPSTQALARRLRVSPRSLRRELRSYGTSYSELLAQARRELALRYALESPRRSGAEIAQRLGYVDPHTFYRAFKRWTGVALSAYRSDGQGGPASTRP